MKIAVLSDIHGNYVALERCIEYALNRNIDKFIFLGDYVGELAYPQKTLDLLHKLDKDYECTFIRGNKENYWINYRANGECGWSEKSSTTGSLLYTYSNLTTKDIDFFNNMPITARYSLNGYPELTICHGSPNKVSEKMLPDNENTLEILSNNPNSYILCGHTHVQGKIVHNEKMVINPGAVGVSLHGNGKAQMAILKGSKSAWEEEFVSLDYDVESVIEDLHVSGLFDKACYWCKVTEHLLRTGEVSHGTVLSRAMALCIAKTGECNWPDIPEECWETAVKEFI